MKHEILTGNGVPVQLVRYCKYNNNNYLIFTNESNPDSQGYVTIHISQVENENSLKGVAADYNVAKDIVKTISNEVKNNMPLSVIDLNYHELDGINIVGDQAFRVLPNYVECLEKNRIEFEEPAKNQVDFSSTPFTENVQFQPNMDNTNLNGNETNIDSNPFVINNNVTGTNISNPFNEPTISSPLNSFNDSTATNNMDYQKMYSEQTELVKKLESEIEIYKSKIEMLKNIINN